MARDIANYMECGAGNRDPYAYPFGAHRITRTGPSQDGHYEGGVWHSIAPVQCTCGWSGWNRETNYCGQYVPAKQEAPHG